MINNLLLSIAVHAQALRGFAADRTAHRTGDRERGATAVEYGLLIAAVVVVIAAAVFLLGEEISGIFTEATSSLNGG